MIIKKNSFFLYADSIDFKSEKNMEDSVRWILENLIKLTRSSENKFKVGNFKEALEEKLKANAILKSKSCNKKMIQNIEKNCLV